MTCPEKLEKAVNYCQDYRSDYARIEECDTCSTVITSCDECWRDDIEEIAATVNGLTGDVAEYEQCYDMKTKTINDVAAVSADIDALILQLSQDDTDAWQAVFTEYNMPCARIPLRYCAMMTSGDDKACSSCNDVCQQIDAACQVDFSG